MTIRDNKKILVPISVSLGIAIAIGCGIYFVNRNKDNGSTEIVINTNDNSVIDLSSMSNDLVITEAGSYHLTGTLANSIFVRANSNDDVTLILDNVEINSSSTAAIAALTGKSLTITLADGSSNTVSDGGESDYDGAIYSEIPLYFEGTGTLTVHGQQTDGEGIATTDNNITFNGGNIYVYSNDDGLNAGGDNGGTITINGGSIWIQAGGDGVDSNNNAIVNGGTLFTVGSATGGDSGFDTDNGYTINGGTVIALGSDMLETPEADSKQATLAFQLDSVVSAGAIVSLQTTDGEEIISFVSEQNFKTIVISSDKLSVGTSYVLYSSGTHSGVAVMGIYGSTGYSGGNQLSVGGSTNFALSSQISSFGSNQGGMAPGGGMTPPNGGAPDRGAARMLPDQQ